MPEKEEKIARMNFRQAIVVAIITAGSTILVTLISSGFFGEGKEGPIIPDCSIYEEQIAKLENEDKNKIEFATIRAMSDRYFGKQNSKEAVMDSIRNLINMSDELRQDQSHYTYKLFVIQRIMAQNPRNNINTRIENETKETYAIIQQILKELEFYSLEIDGDRLKTYIALKGFQESINKTDSGYFKTANFGIFGNLTLMAIRAKYEGH